MKRNRIVKSVAIVAAVCFVSSCSTVTSFKIEDENESFQVSCQNDTECEFDEICDWGYCSQVCNEFYLRRHKHTVCIVTTPHTPLYRCSDGYTIDPHSKDCEPICHDDDCPSWAQCFMNECEDACDPAVIGKYPESARCRSFNHTAHLFCPRGFSGDPRVNCYKPCETNDNCDQREFCVDGKCHGVCDPTYNQYDEKAECYPLGEHKALWCCPTRYPGDPSIACGKNCTIENDCEDYQRCVNNECRYSCNEEFYTVVKDAKCIIVANTAHWTCPEGFHGDPFVDCENQCDDQYCADEDRCVNNTCSYACDKDLFGTIVKGSTCHATNHTAHWICPKNFHGDPFVSCDDSCNVDDDCLDSERCLNRKCVTACSRDFVKNAPNFAMCYPHNHTAQVFDCSFDRSPAAVEYCERRHLRCITDNDCLLSAVCSDGQCLRGCNRFECKNGEICKTEMHEPKCEQLW